MSRYKSKNKATVIYLGRKRPNRARWVIIGIILIIIIVVPIYGTTLRYDTSILFRSIFSSIGEICITIGCFLVGISIALTIVSFLRGSIKLYFKWLIIGVVLLWVGAFLTETQFSFFSSLFGKNNPQQGYY